MMRKRTGLFLFGFVCISIAIILAVWMAIKPKFEYVPPHTRVATAFKSQQKLEYFHLYDTEGNIFTDKSLRGYWTLLFFGYTKCPDICPSTLNIIRETWNIFAAKGQSAPVRFVFADISSKDATLSELKSFLKNYNQNFLGLHGSDEQMHRLSDQLGIYANQQPQGIDHTASLMLIDPQGQLCAVFTPPFDADDLAHDLTILTL